MGRLWALYQVSRLGSSALPHHTNLGAPQDLATQLVLNTTEGSGHTTQTLNATVNQRVHPCTSWNRLIRTVPKIRFMYSQK
jgi:hypothetical protein